MAVLIGIYLFVSFVFTIFGMWSVQTLAAGILVGLIYTILTSKPLDK